MSIIIYNYQKKGRQADHFEYLCQCDEFIVVDTCRVQYFIDTVLDYTVFVQAFDHIHLPTI